MRRAEKEIFDEDIIRNFLENNSIVRVAFNTGGAPYIVPLVYGFDYDGRVLTLYMHGAREGRKIELAMKAPHVGFEIDHAEEVIPEKTASKTTIKYQSIIGTGYMQILDDPAEKEHCFNRIMYQLTGNGNHDYTMEVLEMTAAFKLAVDSFTMKKG